MGGRLIPELLARGYKVKVMVRGRGRKIAYKSRWAGVEIVIADALNEEEDRTGLLTIHPELLDQDGRITDEDLLTVRFSGDTDPPQSAETSAE